MKWSVSLVGLLTISSVASAQYTSTLTGNILFADQGCRHLLGGIPSGTSTRMSCKRSTNCSNDSYASVIFRPGVKAGTVIRLYDDPDGKKTDDWVEIRAIAIPNEGRVCLESLERSESNAMYSEVYHHKNGLNGKVSFVEVIVP